ncbi:MAG TPA: tRNA lysidine(34) synthetase TilS, partial [Gemmatimonadales bacterium]|nr:tRNA lysidine(34) synthetase TilS [Gemmatimonadales bacterium]
ALLPLIESRLGGKVRADLLTLGRHAARDAKAWDALPELLPELDLRSTTDSFSVARLPLAGYDAPVAVAILRALAHRVGIPLGPRHAHRLHELARRQSGRRVELGGGWVGEAVFDRLSVGRLPDAPREPISIQEAGTAVFGEYVLEWRNEQAPARIDRAGWTTWVADSEDGLTIRAPQAGDRMAPLGGVGRREVRRLLMEARVPRAARAGYPLLAHGETIVWVPGICRGEARVPPPGTPAVRLDVTEYDQA